VLVAAALVPPTALLVPGAAGRAAVLGAERAAALEAVGAVLAAHPEIVVVVVPGTVRAEGRLRPTLTAAGVPDAAWRGAAGQRVLPGPEDAWETTSPSEVVIDDVAAAVGLWLLARAGWSGPTRVLGVGEPASGSSGARPHTGLAAAELAGAERVAALLLGGGSARRGPDAPLAEDPRAEAADAAMVAWLETLDPDGPRGLDDALAAELAISALGPARVLVGLPGLRCTGVSSFLPLGATYLVATWQQA
jgi:hypothetical protein